MTVSEVVARRITWLRKRAKLARDNNDHLLRAELEETADQFEMLCAGIQNAIEWPKAARVHLSDALSNIEKRATI